MTQWTDESKRHLEEYLERVADLCRQAGDDPEEVVSGLREHIEAEVEKECGTSLVTQGELRKVLAATGTPEEIVGVDVDEATGDMHSVPEPSAPPVPPVLPAAPRKRQDEAMMKTRMGCAFFLALMILAGFAVPVYLCFRMTSYEIEMLASIQKLNEFRDISELYFNTPSVPKNDSNIFLSEAIIEKRIEVVAKTRESIIPFEEEGVIIHDQIEFLKKHLNEEEQYLREYLELIQSEPNIEDDFKAFFKDADLASDGLHDEINKVFFMNDTHEIDEVKRNITLMQDLRYADRLLGRLEILSKSPIQEPIHEYHQTMEKYLSLVYDLNARLDKVDSVLYTNFKTTANNANAAMENKIEHHYKTKKSESILLQSEDIGWRAIGEMLKAWEERQKAIFTSSIHRNRYLNTLVSSIAGGWVFICSILLIIVRVKFHRMSGQNK